VGSGGLYRYGTDVLHEYSLGTVWRRDYGEMKVLDMPVHVDV